jgi:predicted dehydrogenase
MHREELRNKQDRFRIVAVCDPLPVRREMAERELGCRTYTTLAEMLGDPEVELVDIASRSTEHCAHASTALRAGKVVFLEKPMGVRYEDARKLYLLAQELGGQLFVRQNRRFEPAFQHIREMIAEGLLGDVFEVKLRRLSFQRRDDWQTLRGCGGGLLLNWGPHIVDHALRFLDCPVADQWSDLKRVAAVGDAEDHLKIILRGENGRVVDMEISGGAALLEPEYLIWGSRGALTCTGETITVKYLDPEAPLPPRIADSGTPKDEFGSGEELPWIERTFEACPRSGCDMSSIWDALYLHLREGAPYPITLEESLEVMRVIEVAKETTGFATPPGV